jgi:FkbH-like protein
MSAAIFRNLEWLPPAKDFQAACQQVTNSVGDCGTAIKDLATHALTDAQLKRLSMLIARLRADGRSLDPLTPFRLGLIGNGTLDLIAPALVATAARHGFLLDCVTSDYGQAVQEALDPDSKINRARCDAVLIALDYRGLPLRASLGDPEEAARSVHEAIDLIRRMRAGLKENSGAHSIVQTLAASPKAMFGSLDRLAPGTLRHTIEAFNLALCAEPRDDSSTLLDVAALAQIVGLTEWHSPTQWNMAKLPFSADYVPLYADHVCRLVGALRGKSRRVLILDLDNTLWGGVIGDDGIEGIVLGEGDGTGEAFLSVQRLALSLRERGVVLAVSSKNTDSVARQAFRDHPEMLLREDHIAVFQANWNDKATNIKAIADELSLGLDAMVFLDDNPAERALVRRFLPQVAVPELPEDPALYARTLSAAGYFEAVAFSDEDRGRADFYQDNARRASLGKTVANIDDYLAALDMEASFLPFDAVNRARICQLINKSNQFNLTTRRYTESEIRALEQDASAFTLQVRLKDRFGDNGMISVVICREHDASTWSIDTWLMSCRVLGRGVERMVLRHVIEQARLRGVETLIGDYRPTARNDLVREHYRKLGFEQVATASDGGTSWALPTSTVIAAPPARYVEPTLTQVAAE